MNFNPEYHHRRSIRIQGYDYSKPGLYFITICTEKKNCIFGTIIDKKSILNDLGSIAKKFWVEIPNHFPNVLLHQFIVMPNHIHGIIELKSGVVGAPNVVGAQNFVPLQQQQQIIIPKRNEFQKIIPHSIGAIVRGYKTGVTKWYRQQSNSGYDRLWQRNYYEHIIRDEKSYHIISKYIVNNPLHWKSDQLFEHS
jgi:REP element-mobilizing transposase RayT